MKYQYDILSKCSMILLEWYEFFSQKASEYESLYESYIERFVEFWLKEVTVKWKLKINL